jgi:nicotinamide mononucleotide adenylyltransferase
MDLLFEANRLAGELASELRKTLITEADNKHSDSTERTIVAYSGNFQPFHAGHYKIYRTLVKKFGRDNVYITTTNQQEEPENPMSYEDKKTLVNNMFDIEDGKFQEVKNPFIPIELLKKFNPKTTSLVTVVSTDDVDVIAKSKYFHKYVEGQDLKHYTEAGYYLTIPELTMAVGGLQLTNSQIMQILNSPKTSDGVKSQVFKSVYGTENDEMLNLISNSSTEDGSGGNVGKTDATGQKNYTTPDKTKAFGQKDEPEDESDKDKTPPMQRMVVNPDTGREIKVQSALKYPRWKPVYKKAEKVLKSAGIDRKDRVKEPEVNTRYKERAKNMKKEDLVAYLGQALSEQLHDIVSVDGATLTVPGLGEVHLKLDNSFQLGLKTESDSPAPVAIFGGRFQPYHAGHQHSYEALVNKFGKDNVYIATSDKTNTDTSPLNFEEKKKIMTQMFGMDPSKIVQVVSPYKADEITSKLPSDTPVVWALGEKDIQRLAKSKYFSPYDPSSQSMKGYRDGGYVYEVPQLPIQINGQTISGTAIRNVFAQGSPEAQRALFKRLYGKDDPQILDLLSGRIKNVTQNDTPPAQQTSPSPTPSSSIRDRLKDKIKNPKVRTNTSGA